jgi:hypothetical protein
LCASILKDKEIYFDDDDVLGGNNYILKCVFNNFPYIS